ncbi:MAG: nuclear transport factor 2 family protein [Nitrososphaerales archaeon]
MREMRASCNYGAADNHSFFILRLAELQGMPVIDRDWAEAFAREWVDAWNSHDIERIFSHYTDDFEMTSPLIVSRMGVPSGRLKGKDAIRPYWLQGLIASPPLRFELLGVTVGVNSLAIRYRSVTAKRTVIERIEFDDHQRVVRAEVLHGPSE